jgi:hypothetical protein
MAIPQEFTPGSRVQVQIAKWGKPTRWYSATFIGAVVGCSQWGDNTTTFVVETLDGVIWPCCHVDCVRASK